MQETGVLPLGREDPLEKEMATHPSILAWRIPWMKELGGLQSMGSLGVGHDWVTSLSLFTFHFHALEKEMATHSSVLALRMQGMGEPGGLPSMGSHRVRHDWSDVAAAAAWIYYCFYQFTYSWAFEFIPVWTRMNIAAMVIQMSLWTYGFPLSKVKFLSHMVKCMSNFITNCHTIF